mmetsp:Transcript_60060/g.159641  ORF Transcript_60060/g.159641 Transcript_60060/m.159641 type:complete len:251 (+) Transcript_60060:1611-2363(+)
MTGGFRRHVAGRFLSGPSSTQHCIPAISTHTGIATYLTCCQTQCRYCWATRQAPNGSRLRIFPWSLPTLAVLSRIFRTAVTRTMSSTSLFQETSSWCICALEIGTLATRSTLFRSTIPGCPTARGSALLSSMIPPTRRASATPRRSTSTRRTRRPRASPHTRPSTRGSRQCRPSAGRWASRRSASKTATASSPPRASRRTPPAIGTAPSSSRPRPRRRARSSTSSSWPPPTPAPRAPAPTGWLGRHARRR